MAAITINKYLAAFLLLALIPAPVLARDEFPAQIAEALKTKTIAQQLARGEVVTATFIPDMAIKGVSMWAALEITAPLEQVFDAINLCEQAVKWHQKLESCKQINQGPGYADFEQKAKFNWFLPKLEYVFRAKYPRLGEIRFQALSGDIKTLQGGWNLYPSGETTLAVYFITIQPKFPSPDWVIAKTLRTDLPKMLKTIDKIAVSIRK